MTDYTLVIHGITARSYAEELAALLVPELEARSQDEAETLIFRNSSPYEHVKDEDSQPIYESGEQTA